METNKTLNKEDYSTIALIKRILKQNAEKDKTFGSSSDYPESLLFLEKVREEISFFETTGTVVSVN